MNFNPSSLQVSYARPSSETIKGANLYVSGLSKSMTQSDVDNLFAPYGVIVTSRILCDPLTGEFVASREFEIFSYDTTFNKHKIFKSISYVVAAT